jgi:hypothetical protein
MGSAETWARQKEIPWGDSHGAVYVNGPVGSAFVVDLEWNRKSIFEKLDWLKHALDELVTKANHNISVQQEQLRAITARLAALEKPARSAPAITRSAKKPRRVSSRQDKQSPRSKRTR